MRRLLFEIAAILAQSCAVCFAAAYSQFVLQDNDNLRQPGSGQPKTLPDRPLPWGDLNVLATTDTHGWLRGHTARSQPESSYSGDWGDFYSFVYHLSEEADRTGRDLLLVDSGDLHDGNGLVDADTEIRGKAASILMSRIPYTLMTVGNHELYNYTIALDFHQRFYPLLGDRYLASNVFIDVAGQAKPELRMLAFGTLFNFQWSAKQVHVQPIVEMVQEEWFLTELQREPVDAVLLLGHIPAKDAEWRTLQRAVRQILPKTPILTFAGHEHIRDCVQLDNRSMILASGRYFETVGFMSVDKLKSDALHFERRYLDNNRETYRYHTNAFAPRFDTWRGLDISAELTRLFTEFELSHTFGISPRTYYRTRYPVSSPKSVYNLLLERVFPSLIQRSDRQNPQPLFILNSGSVRFDIGKGPFTVDSQSLVFPFINRNYYIPDVPSDVASKILASMNEIGEYGKESGSLSAEVLANGSYGYVTHDKCPGRGDDTPHLPLPYIEPATFLATTQWNQSAKTVDVAFFDFITEMVVDALNRVQEATVYTRSAVRLYTNHTSNQILATYAERYWNT